MRALVTGAGGQLGRDVVASWGAAGDEVIACGHAALDLSDRDQVLGAITSTAPDVVVNCGAWTAVDACEGDPDRALAANGLAVRWVAEACDRVGAHLVQISTDYVFDGTLERPYHEWDEPNPMSVYGLTKLIGEREAAVLGTHASIVRTSWVCSAHGANMVATIMRLASTHPVLSFVDDQIGHPTFTADLAPLLRRIALDRRSGIYHLTNQAATSWYAFAVSVVMLMGKDPEMVRPIRTDELVPARPAPRPANSVLDNAAARMGGIPLLRDHREALADLIPRLMAASPAT